MADLSPVRRPTLRRATAGASVLVGAGVAPDHTIVGSESGMLYAIGD